MKRLFCIVLCEESPYDLIIDLGPFSVILQPWNFCEFEFTYFSSACKRVRKSKKYFDRPAFNYDLTHSNP